MATQLLPILPGTLPVDACYATEQDRLNAYAENMQAILAGGLAFYNYGDTEPSVDNRSYPWLNTNTGLWYIYSGVWRSPRPVKEQDTNYRILWAGAEADVPLIDGGTAGTATVDTGPFWEIDTQATGRSPMAPGLIAGSDPAKTLAVGEQYGAGSLELTVAQLPEHSHEVQYDTDDEGSGFPSVANGDSNVLQYNTQPSGSGEPVNVVHPVIGLWILKPTIRRWYTI